VAALQKALWPAVARPEIAPLARFLFGEPEGLDPDRVN